MKLCPVCLVVNGHHPNCPNQRAPSIREIAMTNEKRAQVRDKIAAQIAEFEQRGGEIQKIERGASATDMVGGKFNEKNRTRHGGLGITIKEVRNG